MIVLLWLLPGSGISKSRQAKEREARVKSGQEKFVDWEAAKQELRLKWSLP